MTLRYGSLCSGVEAATLAWQGLGWQAAWFAEIDPFACAVLAQRWPHVPNYGDIVNMLYFSYGVGSPCRTICTACGSPPCMKNKSY